MKTHWQTCALSEPLWWNKTVTSTQWRVGGTDECSAEKEGSTLGNLARAAAKYLDNHFDLEMFCFPASVTVPAKETFLHLRFMRW